MAWRLFIVRQETERSLPDDTVVVHPLELDSEDTSLLMEVYFIYCVRIVIHQTIHTVLIVSQKICSMPQTMR
jgi:hypothetical protein